MSSNSCRALVGAALLCLVAGGCGSSQAASGSPPQIITVDSTPATDRLASLCNKTTYELNVIYRHTIGGSGPREFKQRLTKLATQSLPVIDSALGKVTRMSGPGAAEARADLESSRRQIRLVGRAIAHARSDNFGAFPRGTVANLWRVSIGCAHSRKPISG